MNIRTIAISAASLMMLATFANAASVRATHEVPSDGDKCQVGTLDLGTTECIVKGKAPASHVKYATRATHEISSYGDKCPVGTLDSATTECIVNGKAHI